MRREPLQDSALSGKDSAWKSVNDADQTLLTTSAQACGRLLKEHSKRFLDGVDWAQDKDVPAFKAAAASFLEKSPLPECLISAPPGEDVD